MQHTYQLMRLYDEGNFVELHGVAANVADEFLIELCLVNCKNRFILNDFIFRTLFELNLASLIIISSSTSACAPEVALLSPRLDTTRSHCQPCHPDLPGAIAHRHC